MNKLEGKIALCTASGQGIGLATAKAFAAAGAYVIATDINENSLKELQHIVSETHLLDVTDKKEIKAIFTKIQDPDILFNCAGYVHDGTILNSTDDEWDFAFSLNAKSMFHMIKAVIPGMIKKGGGSIINISSVSSSVKGIPSRFIYSASKSAVLGMTKSVSADFVDKGIRCNAICPGTIQSPSLNERIANLSGDFEEAKQKFIDRQPLGRLGTAEEIAALATYLASDDSNFTTGQFHIVDGGICI